MIIDSHIHMMKVNNVDWKPEQLITSMDEAGIDISLIISFHLTNSPIDHIIQLTKSQPRFRAIGNVEFANISDEQIEKIIHHLEKKEIMGVKLYPGYEDYLPSDRRLAKLISFCEKNNHPIVVHTGVMMVGLRGYVEQVNPIHIDRIANDFPNLKIVMAHAGNPWLTDTIAVMWRNKNVYTDISGFFEEFRPISTHEAELFVKRMNQFRDMLGSFDRVIFGTDWPLYSQKEYIDVVRKIELTDLEKEKVFWKNANEVYNLSL